MPFVGHESLAYFELVRNRKTSFTPDIRAQSEKRKAYISFLCAFIYPGPGNRRLGAWSLVPSTVGCLRTERIVWSGETQRGRERVRRRASLLRCAGAGCTSPLGRCATTSRF